ncbi:MAG TPA: DUF2807 domain-containing protein [Caulobacteraceae bacterium]|jgi:hypothetical protein|nr:DUF2807 domain-containing protein [Caulobacteraceae bacterium]
MTRPLLLVAGCGLVAALLSFAIALALGPIPWSDWDWDFPHGRDRGPPATGGGPTVTRELAWPGGEELQVNVPATIAYTQGPVSRVVVTGPQGAVDHLRFDDETLRFDRRVRSPGEMRIVMTAPDVREFMLHGSQRLTIAGYDQDRLDVHVMGSSTAVANGRARSVEIHIAGSGDIDLGGVAADDAEVHIAGSGKAVLSPKASAEIHIAGSGDVILTTRPARLEQHIAGSGRIVQGEAVKPAA